MKVAVPLCVLTFYKSFSSRLCCHSVIELADVFCFIGRLYLIYVCLREESIKLSFTTCHPLKSKRPTFRYHLQSRNIWLVSRLFDFNSFLPLRILTRRMVMNALNFEPFWKVFDHNFQIFGWDWLLDKTTLTFQIKKPLNENVAKIYRLNAIWMTLNSLPGFGACSWIIGSTFKNVKFTFPIKRSVVVC